MRSHGVSFTPFLMENPFPPGALHPRPRGSRLSLVGHHRWGVMFDVLGTDSFRRWPIIAFLGHDSHVPRVFFPRPVVSAFKRVWVWASPRASAFPTGFPLPDCPPWSLSRGFKPFPTPAGACVLTFWFWLAHHRFYVHASPTGPGPPEFPRGAYYAPCWAPAFYQRRPAPPRVLATVLVGPPRSLRPFHRPVFLPPPGCSPRWPLCPGGICHRDPFCPRGVFLIDGNFVPLGPPPPGKIRLSHH